MMTVPLKLGSLPSVFFWFESMVGKGRQTPLVGFCSSSIMCIWCFEAGKRDQRKEYL